MTRPTASRASRARRALACCLTAVGAVSAPTAGAAVQAGLDTALDYQADADCPGRERFFALVDGAIDPGEKSRLSTPAADLRIRVEIRAAAGGYRGSMEKIDRFGSSEPRVVVSPICGEVARALALTAAFSLAPEAARPDPPLIARQAPASPAAESARSGDSTQAAWLVALGASGGGALSTGILSGIEGSGGRAYPVAAAALPFTVSWRLRTTFARNDWAGNAPVARFALWTGALELCAMPRPFARGMEAGLCASGESGWLRARGVQIENPRTSDSLWLAFGGGALVRVPLAARWQLEGRGSLLRPLRRVHFAFETPAQPVGETAAVTWAAALALVARFP